MPIASRDELKEYCLRRLGAPVIEINVDEDQVEDRIQDAIDFWHEYHFDGVETIYLKAQVEASSLVLQTPDASMFIPGELVTGQTSGAKAHVHAVKDASSLTLVNDVSGTFVDGETITGDRSAFSAALAASNSFTLGNWDKQYFDISDAVIGVVRVFLIGGISGSRPGNIFDVAYQFRLTDMYDLLSTDLVYYTQIKQQIQTLEMILPGERTIRFNRKSNRLHLDVNWRDVLPPGTFIVAECYRILDPNEFVEVYNDMFLKRYATALIKRQWGENMKKFEGIQLPGGVTLNGLEIYKEAMAEIAQIEEEMISRYSLPVQMMIG